MAVFISLEPAERMPFPDTSFDRVFSIGVMHFWKEPLAPLQEIHRVMRPGSIAISGALDARSPPQFARPEFGFHLRSATEWATLFRQAGFGTVDARNIELQQLTPDGKPTKRYTIRVTARR